MTTTQRLTNKLLREPSDLQFLVVADCLQELGLAEQARVTRLGFHPDVCAVWHGGGRYASSDDDSGDGAGGYSSMGNGGIGSGVNGDGFGGYSSDGNGGGGGCGGSSNGNSLQVIS